MIHEQSDEMKLSFKLKVKMDKTNSIKLLKLMLLYCCVLTSNIIFAVSMDMMMEQCNCFIISLFSVSLTLILLLFCCYSVSTLNTKKINYNNNDLCFSSSFNLRNTISHVLKLNSSIICSKLNFLLKK